VPKLNARGVRSKQAAYLRYIASTDISATANELGLSTKTLKHFLSAKPETVLKSPDRFTHVLSLKPAAAAKENKRRLVPRLSGQRLKTAFSHMNTPEVVDKLGRTRKIDTDWTVRSIRYTQATRTKYRVVSPEGMVSYVPVQTGLDTHHRQEYAKRQIVNGLANENTRSIARKYHAGTWSYDKAIEMTRELWKNSDAAFTPEMERKYFGTEEA
jgi:hypothetical protein